MHTSRSCKRLLKGKQIDGRCGRNTADSFPSYITEEQNRSLVCCQNLNEKIIQANDEMLHHPRMQLHIKGSNSILI